MLRSRCAKDGCRNDLHGMCKCEGTILFCKEHYLEHVEQPSSRGHQLLRPCIKPSEEMKQPTINKLQELKNELKNYKVQAIFKANKIIVNFEAAFEQYFSQIHELEANCDKMIEMIDNGKEFLDIAPEDSMESVLKLNARDIECWEWDINESFINCEEKYDFPFKISFATFLEAEIKSNELSFFRYNTKNLDTINLDTLQVSSAVVTLQTQDPIIASESCMLPDKSYFYCCNSNIRKGLMYIIDKDKNVWPIQNSKVKNSAPAIFYNNSIYLMGGKDKLAERYDLRQNCWESLAALSQNYNFEYSCGVLYKDLILITGCYMQKIIIYFISQNYYRAVLSCALRENCLKFMLKGNNRIYVFEKMGKIFESAENGLMSWNQIGTNGIPDVANQSSIVRYKGSLYFVVYNRLLWKFDLSSKQVSQVATI